MHIQNIDTKSLNMHFTNIFACWYSFYVAAPYVEREWMFGGFDR